MEVQQGCKCNIDAVRQLNNYQNDIINIYAHIQLKKNAGSIIIIQEEHKLIITQILQETLKNMTNI